MTVRRRIFLAALAVGVVGALVVLIWSAGPKDTTTRLEFTLLGYTNDDGKLAIITIKNRGDCRVRLPNYVVNFEGRPMIPAIISWPSRMSLAAGSSCTTSVEVFRPTGYGSLTNRWQIECLVIPETLLGKARRKLEELHLMRHRISPLDYYNVTSDWFTQ